MNTGEVASRWSLNPAVGLVTFSYGRHASQMGVPIKSVYTGLMEASFEAQLHALQTLEKGVAGGPNALQAHQWVKAER